MVRDLLELETIFYVINSKLDNKLPKKCDGATGSHARGLAQYETMRQDQEQKVGI